LKSIIFKAIGFVRSPFKDLKEMPIQPLGGKGIAGSIELEPEFVEGLKDLDKFSYITLLYHLHEMKDVRLRVVPFLDKEERGVFSTRAPSRPNAIGLSTVRLLKIEGTTLFIEDVDILDATPIIDIKPFIPAFDHREDCKTGWLSGNAERSESLKSDGRFE